MFYTNNIPQRFNFTWKKTCKLRHFWRNNLIEEVPGAPERVGAPPRGELDSGPGGTSSHRHPWTPPQAHKASPQLVFKKFRLPSEWCDSTSHSHNWHRSGLDDEKRSDLKIQARLQSKQRGEVQMCRLHLWCLLQGDNVHAKQMRDYSHWCVHNLFVDMALSSLMLTGHRLDDPDIWRWDFCLQR